MVIGGEKTPAFSARTLELPPPQTDNTSRIIEHTRRHYARERSSIEQEISKAIQPETAEKTSTQQQSHTTTRRPQNIRTATASGSLSLPIPHTTKVSSLSPSSSDITNTIKEESQNSSNITPTDNPPKKKRTRSRRKKTASQTAPQSPQPQLSINTQEGTAKVDQADRNIASLKIER